MNERPTPETDANIWASISGCIRGQHGEPIERCYVPADFARKLEMERDEARDELRRIDNEVAFDAAWSEEKMLHEAVGIIIRQRDELLAALETTLEHVPITLQGKARAAIAAVKGGKL